MIEFADLVFLLCSYVSETERRHVFPSQAQRHIVAGLASVVGGLSAPYEKASHIHERPVVNWLLAAGCHPFGPFSNASHVSQLLQDVALVRHTFLFFPLFVLPLNIIVGFKMTKIFTFTYRYFKILVTHHLALISNYLRIHPS